MIRRSPKLLKEMNETVVLEGMVKAWSGTSDSKSHK